MKVLILLFLILALLVVPGILGRSSTRAAKQPLFFLIFGILQVAFGAFATLALLHRPGTGWTIGVVYLVIGAFNLRKAIRLFRGVQEQVTTPTPLSAQAPLSLDPPLPPRGRAYLTFWLLALLTGIFVLEQILSVTPTEGLFKMGLPSLIGMGALNRELVQSGQWYRVFSAIFLHHDAAHLLFNGITLWFTGWLLENRIGRAWFAAIFLVGGLCGSIFSLVLNPSSIVSEGASGAITALLAAGFVINYRMPEGRDRSAMQVILLRLLIPAVAPMLFSTPNTHHIDYADHLGGAIAGVLLGLCVVFAWPRDALMPGHRQIATAISLVGAVLCLYSASPVISRYRSIDRDFTLIPTAELPKSGVEGIKQSFSLVALYPRDPRARLLRSAALVDAGDFQGAEKEVRASLADDKILNDFFLPEVASGLYAVLGQVLATQGQAETAIEELSQAIQINPIPALYEARGNAFQEVGKWNESIDDFAHALGKGGASAGVYYGVGMDHFLIGNYGEAVSDFSQGAKLDPTKAYAPLWLFLARARAGIPNADALKQDETRFKPEAWPNPVAALYLGQATPDDVHNAAAKGDAKTQRDQQCEATFYIAEYELMKSNLPVARAMLTVAAENCPAGFIERNWAKGELEKIAKDGGNG
ncbi:MAG: rhomboid family intramembrane serine protease [Rhodospirillaceae bacterium]|nr:MAG: rhomboid family intramembrane serine protease [Rhodospirillaceae bacterium]